MKKMAKISGICVTALLVGCTSSDPRGFDPLVLQQVERDRAREVISQPKRPLPTTLESPYLPGPDGNPRTPPPPTTGPSLESGVIARMSLHDVVQRAVANNLDVKVAGYTPAIEEARVVEAEARFDPTFFYNLGYERRDQESGFFGTGNARIITNSVGLRQLLSSGGQAEIRYELAWNEPKPRNTTDIFGQTSRVKDPQFWEGDLVLEITQPLLRNFGNNINRARINVNRNNQRISLLDFRQQLEETTLEVERTYWQLVAAQRVVEVNERLLQKTVDTASLLQQRMGQDVTRVQISQANASVENRTVLLIRNKAQVENLSDQLKQLMNDPNMPVASGVLVLPATPPVEEPIRFDRKDQIDAAMDNRLELGQQQLRIDSADITVDVARNNRLPRLDVVGSVANQGLDQDLHNTLEDNYHNTNFNLSLGIQFEIPIGNREANSIHRRAKIQRQQALVQYSSLVSEIALQVTVALREVETTWNEMVATRKAVYAQQDALSALQQREEGGEALTPTFVQLKLDTQASLAQAEASAAEAVSNYNIALATLELRKGTLLRYNNIVMEEENLPTATLD